MKKLLMLSIGLLSSSYILAQDVADAVRYSIDEIQGTARFKAMSGAFGALGGDMSSVNINPAGSAIFNTSHASLSLGLFNKNSDINYFNGNSSSSNSNIDLNQLGAAFIFKNNDSNSKWKKFSLSVAYDRSGDFDDDWIANGTNPNTSIAEYFSANAQGLRLDEISRLTGETYSEAYAEIGSLYGFQNQQAFLGYESFIIEPLEDINENTVYTSNITGGNYDQRFSYAATGYNGKLAFNFATSYNDRLYFGLNLNSHFINYERSTFLRETNSSNGNLTVTNVGFENNLLTTGSGFSLQLGSIAKITEQFRIGLSYNSPTRYRISDETSQYIETTRREDGSLTPPLVINPNVINIYEEYRLQTPGKLTGSLAYVFGKKGLLSFDIAAKDYSNAKFRPTSDPVFFDSNNDIDNNLTSALSYRLGGEYRFKQLSFRGGYRFEESPYENTGFYGDLNGYSLGLGYSFGNLNLDIAFSQAQRDIDYQLYNVGLTDAVKIESKFTDFVLTLGFNI